MCPRDSIELKRSEPRVWIGRLSAINGTIDTSLRIGVTAGGLDDADVSVGGSPPERKRTIWITLYPGAPAMITLRSRSSGSGGLGTLTDMPASHRSVYGISVKVVDHAATAAFGTDGLASASVVAVTCIKPIVSTMPSAVTAAMIPVPLLGTPAAMGGPPEEMGSHSSRPAKWSAKCASLADLSRRHPPSTRSLA